MFRLVGGRNAAASLIMVMTMGSFIRYIQSFGGGQMSGFPNDRGPCMRGSGWLLPPFVMLALSLSTPAPAATVEYIHTDALGTPIAVTDESANVIERSEYEPYGRLTNRPLTDGIGFAGHVQDAATGLTYMQQRYYDSALGRFLSVDPVTAYSDGDTRFFNRYVYGFNNPYRFTDPDGRHTCEASVCAEISRYLMAMRESRDSFKRGSAEWKIVDAALKWIGPQGAPGPHYREAELPGNRVASTNQKGDTRIDLRKVDGNADGAPAIGHEAQHDIDASVNGIANTKETVKAAENNAYSTEAIIAGGLGVKYAPGALEKAVEQSVENWLKRQEISEKKME